MKNFVIGLLIVLFGIYLWERLRLSGFFAPIQGIVDWLTYAAANFLVGIIPIAGALVALAIMALGIKLMLKGGKS